LLRIALRSIEKFAPDSKVIVVDVGSPLHSGLVRESEFREVAFRYEAWFPKSWFGVSAVEKITRKSLGLKPPRQGSLVNGYTLNLGLQTLEEIPEVDYFMTVQTDIMFTSHRLLDLLRNMVTGNVAAAGVRGQSNFDKSEETLHSLGCLWRRDAFKSLSANFLPDFPNFDVGEHAIHLAREKGFQIASLINSYSNKSQTDQLDPSRSSWDFDKTYSSSGELVFLHLGRGIPKSVKANSDERLTLWKSVARDLIG
jgi:hypothetical protein